MKTRITTSVASLFFAALIMLMPFAMSGCGDKQIQPEGVVLKSDKQAPSWVAPTDYNYSSSMTAIVKPDLAQQYGKDAEGWQLSNEDMLAAFVGDICCGVGVLQDGLFFIYITTPQDLQEDNLTISLRYYSSFFRNIFESSESISYINDGALGTVSQPYVPQLAPVK